jgi:hypothetical protein
MKTLKIYNVQHTDYDTFITMLPDWVSKSFDIKLCKATIHIVTEYHNIWTFAWKDITHIEIYDDMCTLRHRHGFFTMMTEGRTMTSTFSPISNT